jgi:hypothetical protein
MQDLERTKAAFGNTLLSSLAQHAASMAQEPQTANVVGRPSAEEIAWATVAGKENVELKGVNLNDNNHVNGLYDMLGVKTFAAQTRLIAYIKRLQQVPSSQQQNSKFR